MKKRSYIPYCERLAAALACLLPQAQRDDLRRDKAPAKRVEALFDFHHIEYHEGGGSDHWHNLHPMERGEHRERTATIDIPAIAHSKRVVRSQQEHDARMAAKLYGEPVPTKRKHPIRSAGFRKDITKGFDGCVRSRKIGRKG